jgi:hypothetical protein
MKLRRLMGVAPWAEGNTVAQHRTTTVQCGTAKGLMSALVFAESMISTVYAVTGVQKRALNRKGFSPECQAGNRPISNPNSRPWLWLSWTP